MRIAAIGPNTAAQVKSQIAELTKDGATKLIVDVRRAVERLARRRARARAAVRRQGHARDPRDARAARARRSPPRPATARSRCRPSLLVDTGTSGAAELFASALAGNKRADLIGEHTIGRAASQKLVKLPDGSGLWLTTTRYLTPRATPLHEKGLEPTVASTSRTSSSASRRRRPIPILDKALERLTREESRVT